MKETIDRRNARLESFWSLTGLPVKVIGNPETPAMIFDNRWVLSAYVHNFWLVLMDSPSDGNEVMRIKLTIRPDFDTTKFGEWISNAKHRAASKIVLRGTKPTLYLTGYNFLNRQNGEGRFPVFAHHQPKLYFTRSKAEEISSMIKKDGYNVEVITPESRTISSLK